MMNDNYNLDTKKLADIMAQGLRDRTDLQEEERKFNEWDKTARADGNDDNDAKAQAGDDGDAEA